MQKTARQKDLESWDPEHPRTPEEYRINCWRRDRERFSRQAARIHRLLAASVTLFAGACILALLVG